MRIFIKLVNICFLALFTNSFLMGQTKTSEGPYEKLVIRGATMIDGTGAPAVGPVNVTIEGNMITKVQIVGTPGDPLNDEDILKGATRIIDAQGKYITPGFINMHTHPGDIDNPEDFEYRNKLHLSHGVTTIRSLIFDGESLDKLLKQRELSEKHKVVAPRIRVCASVGAGKINTLKNRHVNNGINTPEEAREWVRYAKKKGVDCIGEIGPTDPELMKAYLDEGNKLGMPSMIHIGFNNTINARQAADYGLDAMEHFYSLFESLLKNHSLRDYLPDHNENFEDHRFPRIGYIADQSYGPESQEWKELLEFFKEKELVLNPTYIIYQFLYDYMKARNADWMAEYAMPELWESFKPDPAVHSGAMLKLTSNDETKWRQYLKKWMQFVNDYNMIGGRVTVGTDANSVYQLEGFSYIGEMILLQETGFTSLEVIRSATLYGAESIFQPYKANGKPIEYGIIRPGLKADILVMDENPLEDFKTLYGTGALRADRENKKMQRVKSLRYTIKAGEVFDSQALLREIREDVKAAKEKTGIKVEIPVLLNP